MDNTENIAQLFEDLAAQVRRHGIVDGTFTRNADVEDLGEAHGWRDARPTGLQTITVHLVIDFNDVRAPQVAGSSILQENES